MRVHHLKHTCVATGLLNRLCALCQELKCGCSVPKTADEMRKLIECKRVGSAAAVAGSASAGSAVAAAGSASGSANYFGQVCALMYSGSAAQVQSTIIPMAIMFRIEDLTSISEEREAELIKYFDGNNLPHIITETHCVISGHAPRALMLKVFDDFIMLYIKEKPNTHTVRIRSDGCKAQFEYAANFRWVSIQSKEGCGLTVVWSFFASCHGKCLCDRVGGALKN